jgi:hypothetical protein
LRVEGEDGGTEKRKDRGAGMAKSRAMVKEGKAVEKTTS